MKKMTGADLYLFFNLTRLATTEGTPQLFLSSTNPRDKQVGPLRAFVAGNGGTASLFALYCARVYGIISHVTDTAAPSSFGAAEADSVGRVLTHSMSSRHL